MKKRSKRTTAAAMALLTAAGLTTGSLFDSPADLLSDGGTDSALVLRLDNGADDGGDDAGPGEDESGESRRRSGPRAVLRERVLRLPLVLRLTVVLPLWALGSVLLTALSGLWTLVSPLLGRVGGWALLLLALAACFAGAAKAVFPDLPLKKIFSRRSLVALLLGASALTALDAVLAAAWADYAPVKNAVLSAGFFLALCAALVPFALREQRRRLAAAAEAAERERAERAREPLVFTDGVSTYTVRVPKA